MYKKSKNIKLELRHLNDVYLVFEHYTNNQNIAEENKVQFINLMLQNYISSDKIITEEQIREIKELNARN
jgi:hypothetical protein